MAIADEKLTEHLQDLVVKLMIEDDDFLGLVASQISEDYFSSEIVRLCVGVCLDFYAKYKSSPKDHFADELALRADGLSRDKRRALSLYLQKLEGLRANKDYVIRRINDYIKAREYQRAAIDFAQLVASGRFEDAQNRMYKALKAGLEREEIGIDYLRDFSSLFLRGEENEYLVGTGLDALDAKIGGFNRGNLVVFLGGTKAGKTWCLVHMGKTALLKGLNVLHISHEVPAEAIELRYDMMFSARGTRNIGEEVEFLYYNNRRKRLEKKKMLVQSVFDKEHIRKLRLALRKIGGRLIIKKYPPGTCSSGEIERYLSYLERFEHFVPDVLINDYADIMRLSGSGELREKLNAIYIWMKGLADDRGLLLITASQVNRESLMKEYLTQKSVAEDIRKIANVDAALAICQTEEQFEKGVGRMIVVAGREIPQGARCMFSQCLTIGQFAVSSWAEEDILDEDGVMYLGRSEG